MERLSKRERTHEHEQWCGDCWGKGYWVEVKGGIEWLNGDGKSKIKIN